MKIESPRLLAKRAAENWLDEAPSDDDKKLHHQIHAELLGLGVDPTPAQVNGVIGYDTRTRTVCAECDEENVPVVELGEEPEYGSATADICEKCVRAALKLLEEEKENTP